VRTGQPGIFRKRGIGPKLTELKALMLSRARTKKISATSPPGHPNRAHSELFAGHAPGRTGWARSCQALSLLLRLCTALARPAFSTPRCGSARTGAHPFAVASEPGFPPLVFMRFRYLQPFHGLPPHSPLHGRVSAGSAALCRTQNLILHLVTGSKNKKESNSLLCLYKTTLSLLKGERAASTKKSHR